LTRRAYSVGSLRAPGAPERLQTARFGARAQRLEPPVASGIASHQDRQANTSEYDFLDHCILLWFTMRPGRSIR
jgi:hypothetical protein